MLSSVSASSWDYGILGVYLVLVIGIGVWHSRKENTSEDFLLGGRKMPWLAVGISYMMSLLSTYSLVMIPGEIYSHGLSMWVLSLLTPLFSIGAFFLFMRFYFKMSVYTPYEYLGRRYGQSVRLLVSIQYLFSKVIYLGIVLFSVSIIFENVLGWPVWITIIVVGVVSMIYTVLGGLKAVIWTDVLQFFILAIGLLLAVGMCIYKVKGGLPAIFSISFEHGRGFTQYAELEFYNLNPYIRLCFWFLMLAPITGALNEASFNQISIQRLLSTGSIWQAQKSIFVNAALALPLTLILWIIGLGMYVFYYQNPDPAQAPLLQATMGIRSAGTKGNLLLCAGPNMSAATGGVNFFAYNTDTDQFLGSYQIQNIMGDPVNNIRKWITHDGSTYTGVSGLAKGYVLNGPAT